MPECQGKTCPISMEVIPKEFEYRMSKQEYNVRSLAKMILAARQNRRIPAVPHTRRPIRPIQQTEIFRRAGMREPSPPTELLNEQLLEASERGHLEDVRRLLRAGANVHARETDSGANSVLECAISNEHMSVIKFLLRHVDVNVPNYARVTTLMKACGFSRRNPRIVKLLIQHGANVHAKDREGHNALWYVKRSYSPVNPAPIIKILNNAGLRTI